MKFLSNLLSFSLVFLSLAIISCEDDNATQESDLFGKWNITQAFRDNKPTTTMDEMYFEFAEEGILKTNMTGEVEAYQFEVDDEQISQRAGSIDADYKIESRLDNKLTLTTTLGGKSFRMTLERETME
ncbi:MAG: hypothetical protein AAGJ93_12305 [Bacteroidota bacterium]